MVNSNFKIYYILVQITGINYLTYLRYSNRLWTITSNDCATMSWCQLLRTRYRFVNTDLTVETTRLHYLIQNKNLEKAILKY